MATFALLGSVLALMLLLLASAADAAPKKVLPSWVPVCKRSEPDLGECVRRAVETLRPRLRKGISRLRVPPLDPFELPALRVERDLPALRVNASLANLRVLGAAEFRINSLQADAKALKASADVTVPLLVVTSDYAVTGQLLAVPLQGQGAFSGNFSDVKISLSGSGELYDDAGVERVRVKEIRVSLGLGNNSTFDFDNRDASAAAVADAAATFIRNNADSVLDVVRPVVEETSAEVALTLAQSIFSKIPMAELLPDGAAA